MGRRKPQAVRRRVRPAYEYVCAGLVAAPFVWAFFYVALGAGSW